MFEFLNASKPVKLTSPPIQKTGKANVDLPGIGDLNLCSIQPSTTFPYSKPLKFDTLDPVHPGHCQTSLQRLRRFH